MVANGCNCCKIRKSDWSVCFYSPGQEHARIRFTNFTTVAESSFLCWTRPMLYFSWSVAIIKCNLKHETRTISYSRLVEIVGRAANKTGHYRQAANHASRTCMLSESSETKQKQSVPLTDNRTMLQASTKFRSFRSLRIRPVTRAKTQALGKLTDYSWLFSVREENIIDYGWLIGLLLTSYHVHSRFCVQHGSSNGRASTSSWRFFRL